MISKTQLDNSFIRHFWHLTPTKNSYQDENPENGIHKRSNYINNCKNALELTGIQAIVTNQIKNSNLCKCFRYSHNQETSAGN